MTGTVAHLLLCIFFSALMFNIYCVLINPLTTITSLSLIFALSLIVSIVIAIPFLLLFNWGAYLTIYIKGQSIKANMLVELATDMAHLLSFFLRINIQLIRLVIFAGVSYTYSELYLELVYPYLNTTNSIFSSYVLLTNLISMVAHLLFEIGHFWSIVAMQSGAFALIIFIITQFLYTAYLYSRLQEYFINLR